VHEEETPRNIQIARTKGAISLGPSGNLQGGFKVMALNSGKNIVRHSWDVIPMPDVVIAHANALVSDQPHQMTFMDSHDRLIGDIEIPVGDADKDDADHFPGVELVIADDINIPGFDVVGPEALDEVPAPEVEIDNLKIPHDNTSPIELVPAQAVPPSALVAPPSAPELCRSTRVRTQATQG
jgi:hypothetical protein